MIGNGEMITIEGINDTYEVIMLKKNVEKSKG